MAADNQDLEEENSKAIEKSKENNNVNDKDKMTDEN